MLDLNPFLKKKKKKKKRKKKKSQNMDKIHSSARFSIS